MKIPPYGKPLKELLQQGQLPNNSVYLYLGDLAWEKGKSSSICRPTRTLILPPKHSAIDYEWPVMGCDILMIETSKLPQHYIEDTVYILFNYGATKVTLINIDMTSVIYKKDFDDER